MHMQRKRACIFDWFATIHALSVVHLSTYCPAQVGRRAVEFGFSIASLNFLAVLILWSNVSTS
jgi:hypothetical protein